MSDHSSAVQGSLGPDGAAEILDPAARLRGLVAAMPALGITRLAEQTGLGRHGIPCFAAIRPNSRTVAVHQGKGVDRVSAQISALMEAAEYHFAEQDRLPHLVATPSELAERGRRTLLPLNLLPRGAIGFDTRPIAWLKGRDLHDGNETLVPRDAVTLGTDAMDLPGLSQNTNGLAAGFDDDHALLHGLCELIERDALVLWGFRSDSAAVRTCVDPRLLGDRDLELLCDRIDGLGEQLRLFDITSSIRVPAYYAVLGGSEPGRRHTEVTTGAAAHPTAGLAARKAVLEAVQTRISLISGARDDIDAEDYRNAARGDVVTLLSMVPAERQTTTGSSASAPAEGLQQVLAALSDAGLGAPTAVSLGSVDLGIKVHKLFVPGLEDRLTNRNWRPGPRAARAMLGAT